jgi:hypothetical protein
VFDVYDILATGLGSALAYVAFSWHARKFEVTEYETIRHGEA